MAKLGALRDNPRFDSRPSLAFAMRAGATLDPRSWRERRSITLKPSPEGLSIVLTSPILLYAFAAPWRERTVRLLWLAVAL